MSTFLHEKIRLIIRPIALTILFPVLGFLICLLLKLFCHIEIPRLIQSIINFPIAALAAFVLFPRVLGIPFGKIPVKDFNQKIGLYLPGSAWKHIILGVMLAACTLSGMLVASIISRKYILNYGAITLTHLIFALNPGLWEEVFYRGIQMLILLGLTKSIRKAVVIQVVLFGLLHIKGFDLSALIDAVSVIVITIGFTYTAYKTGTLIAGIVFHYLHDALLFFVQIPGGVEWSNSDRIWFYALLWLMVGFGCLVTKMAAEKFNVRTSSGLYTIKI